MEIRNWFKCLSLGGLLGWVAVVPAGPLPAAGKAEPEAAHWSFRPPRRVPVPKLSPAGKRWARNPVDAFILDRLHRNGLQPSPPADPASLLRRVTLDLTGLPPTLDEQAEFLADPSPAAYDRVVDRLLASPEYGVRWAQHWLDVVRFAETNGYELDGDRPHAFRYRDYVVHALNQDVPFDRFLAEQIAGDELAIAETDPARQAELRVATGFLLAGPRHVVGGNTDPGLIRQEWLTEAVNGVSNTFLGLTIQCARCHNHKYDPIPQADYYRLQAILAPADDMDWSPPSTPERQRKLQEAVALRADLERQMVPIKAQIKTLEKPYFERVLAEKRRDLPAPLAAALNVPEKERTPLQRRLAGEANAQLKVAWDEVVGILGPDDRQRRAGLRAQLLALERRLPPPPEAFSGVSDRRLPPPVTQVLFLGELKKPRETVEAGFPRALCDGRVEEVRPNPRGSSTGRRSALAEWLNDPTHPLTARVMVNRVWAHHFGRGLVATPNDFGKNGSRPTHPELLDWLAVTFNAAAGPLEQGGGLGRSVKSLHRLLVTSATYRQSSSPSKQTAATDPNNRWLGRMNRLRLDAEAIRDSVLAASGRLNRQQGGPSVRVPLEPEVYDTIFTEGEPDGLWFPTEDPAQYDRRSLYLLRKRNVRLPMLVAFDAPDMMSSCGARDRSVHSLQALTLMNSDFMTEHSRALGDLLRKQSGDRMETLYRRTLGRVPTPKERQAVERFLGEHPADDPQAWTDLSLALLNTNEFLYLR